MILTLLIALASLIALMVIHEFGHFIIAKKFGVKVEEFGIGYPPRMFGKQFGETFYSVNWLPLGAFVKIYGEEGDVDDYRSFANLSIGKRIWIVLGGVLAFWVASAIIFSVVSFIGASVPVGDQDVAGFTNVQVSVVAVQPDTPAANSGLKPGDVFKKIASQKYESAQAGPEVLVIDKIGDFQSFIKRHASEQLQLSFERNGVMMEVAISPRVSYPANEGPTGVSLERMATIFQKSPWYKAPWEGVVYTGKVTVDSVVGIYAVIANLFSGKGVPDGAQLAGPVGITIFLSRAVEYGPGFFLYFIGSLSVLLALFNVFPIPALDGGKLVFLVIEKLKGSPVSVRVEQALTITFFLALISMSLFITFWFDVPRVVELWRAGL